ncbi:MAG: type II toxin-antitoxin system VapC family toxin [Anaerolineae bacterium]
MAVIDASVYVALVHTQGDHHDRAWAWFEKAQAAGEPVAAPAILLAEVAAALSRGLGEPALARRLVRQLGRSAVVDLVPVTLALALRAAELAVAHRLRGCDALYVALAQQRGESLITFDRQQLERGAAAAAVRQP